MKKIDDSPKFEIGEWVLHRGDKVQVMNIYACHNCPNDACESKDYRHFVYEVYDKNYSEIPCCPPKFPRECDAFVSGNYSPSRVWITESYKLGKIEDEKY